MISPRLSAWLGRLLLKPWFAGCTTIFGVVAGFLGAHFDKEITGNFPFAPPGPAFSPGACVFWVATFLFGMCFAGTLREQAKVAERTSAELAGSTARIEGQTHAIAVAAEGLGRHVGAIETRTHALAGVAGQIDQKTGAVQAQTANLERLVQRLHTLPPSGFLQEYSDSGRLLVQIACQAGPDLGLEELEALVRAQLVCILKIIAVFDAGGSGARYGCNLMLYRAAATLSPADAQAIQARLQFVEDGVQVSGLAGVLDTRPALSVSTESQAQPDPQLAPIALPVPQLAAGVDPLAGPVLPGAPETFLSRQATAFESVKDLDRLRSSGRFTHFVVDRMHAFFVANKAIRSYACFPIYAGDPGPESAPFAVLNIHRNTENAGAAERVPLLNPLLTPLCAGIGALLQTLADRSARLARAPKELP